MISLLWSRSRKIINIVLSVYSVACLFWNAHSHESLGYRVSTLQFQINSGIWNINGFWPKPSIIISISWRSLKFKLHFFWNTGKSWFKKPHFSFLISRVVWFKKDLCYISKNRLLQKRPYVSEFARWYLS